MLAPQGILPPDHPRSRGEYTSASAASAGAMGSSPLSRGILTKDIVTTRLEGIIPALAGNTMIFGIVVDLALDHPRSRGEYLPAGPG